ncbi:MAG TPA: molybdenum cofactor biosynthesis protein MoaE [Terriglobales bacterium]|jgi:molybdopterin synthase catalytic subunit
MQVRVLFFGMLKEVIGRASESLELAKGARVGDLVTHYQQQFPAMQALSQSIAVAVNSEYAGPEWTLNEDDEVGLLPPVSGGSPPRCTLVRTAIGTEDVLSAIKHPEDGAVVIFEGIVRNNTRGRRTLYLDYEAYEEMALKQMESLAGRALQEFKIRDVAIVHRLGRLQIGETSVLIVVASAHRGPGFEACRWLIDTLKRTVPIWKKEYFEDGAVWADGEGFPDEISRPEGTPAKGQATK